MRSNTSTIPQPGLYLITPDGGSQDPAMPGLLEEIFSTAPPVMLQYRDKTANHKSRQVFGARLAELCRRFTVPLIVNDSATLAKELGAAGVHLGRGDGSIRDARALLGETAIIGISCYGCLDRAARAAKEGVDYLAFGSLFVSTTKPQAVECSPQVLDSAKRAFDLPIVAIGGIDTANAAQVLAAGADWLAVISDVFDAPDPVQRMLEYQRIFRNTRHAK